MGDSAANASLVPRRSASTHSEILDDEVCVYEWTRREVHALNPTAARVWEMCDGRTSVSEMADALRAQLNLAQADDLVWLALAEFQEKRLIEGGPALPEGQTRLSRRALIARIGVAAMLPIVTSVIAPTALQAQSLQSQTFNFTGAAQTFTVPAGVISVLIDAYGAQGGAGQPGLSSQGRGGRTQATVSVTPGESLTVNAGGKGGTYSLPGAGAGGFNGGGTGGALAGGGGGASDVRRGATALVIAGGGGGTGADYTPVYAPGPGSGDGGGLSGASGSNSTALGPGGGGGGSGGTPSTGGAGGAAGTGGSVGVNGSAGSGGAGAGVGAPTDNTLGGGGGGGGGYFGGGGGGSSTVPPGVPGGFPGPQGGSGGGGSSYTDPGATSVTHTQGGNIATSNGVVIIRW